MGVGFRCDEGCVEETAAILAEGIDGGAIRVGVAGSSALLRRPLVVGDHRSLQILDAGFRLMEDGVRAGGGRRAWDQ